MIDFNNIINDSAFPKDVSDVGQPAQSINSNLFHPRSPVRIERYLKPKENLLHCSKPDRKEGSQTRVCFVAGLV